MWRAYAAFSHSGFGEGRWYEARISSPDAMFSLSAMIRGIPATDREYACWENLEVEVDVNRPNCVASL